eukprot:3205774-Amphidinium_carterae.2
MLLVHRSRHQWDALEKGVAGGCHFYTSCDIHNWTQQSRSCALHHSKDCAFASLAWAGGRVEHIRERNCRLRGTRGGNALEEPARNSARHCDDLRSFCHVPGRSGKFQKFQIACYVAGSGEAMEVSLILVLSLPGNFA